MDSRQRVMTALNCGEPDMVPFVDWFTPDAKNRVIRAMGLPNDADDLTFAKAIGMDALSYGDNDVMSPCFAEAYIDNEGIEHLSAKGKLKNRACLHLLELPDISTDGYFDGVRRFIDQNGDDDLALFCGLRPGMMNTIFGMGILEFSMALHKDISLVGEIFNRYIDWNIEVVRKVQKMGFDFFVCYDDIAFNSGTMFHPNVFKEVFLPGLLRLSEAFEIPWMFHSDGNLSPIWDDLLSAGMNAVNPFQPDVMDIEKYREKYIGKICFWGNIDLHYTLTRGTPEEVEKEVKQRLKKIAPGGGYIISSANSITDYCKTENILAMINTIKECRHYPIKIQ